ncbi:MAG: YIP1 family protein, partial [Deltaproteobacteria bacterium]|nr:YIP1 family protein [Deltaproteobacteria bacterium]
MTTTASIAEASVTAKPKPPLSDRMPQLPALVAPGAGMEKVARLGRVRWPLLIAVVCSLTFGIAEAVRVDAHESVLTQAEMTGQLKTMSDRQIDEQVKGEQRSFTVKRIGISLVSSFMLFLAYLAGAYVLSWFFRGRSKYENMAPVAAVALLPFAIADVLNAIAVFRSAAIDPEHKDYIPRTLGDILGAIGVQAGPAMTRLAGAFDFFSLWAALLLAYGLVTAANLPRRRALIGTIAAWVCWRL